MSDETGQQRRPHPQQLAAPYLSFDLASELAQLRREGGWQAGHNARTLVKLDDLRIVLIALTADSRIPGHQTAGCISIQAIAGHVRVHAEGRTFDLRSEGLLALSHGVPHDVQALEDSAILLTIAGKGSGAS